MKAGVYDIVNLINGKNYVGRAVILHRRRRGHFYSLRGGCHDNPHLQAAWNKYGEAAFLFIVLEYCEANTREQLEKLLLQREDWWMVHLDSRNPSRGYNKRSAELCLHSEETKMKISAANKGRTGWVRGKPFSEEHRANISAAKRGKPLSAATRAAAIAANTGRIHTAEERQRRSVALKGRPGVRTSGMTGKAHTPEARAKMSAALKGIPKPPRSEEHRARISEVHRGKTLTPEHRAKLVESHKGFTGRAHSDETKARMAASKTGLTHSPEARAKISAASKGRPWSEARRAAHNRRRAPSISEESPPPS